MTDDHRGQSGDVSAEAVQNASSYDREAPTPDVGSRWMWGREPCTVTRVEWNGEEWWVQTVGPSGRWWNDLSRFWEAVAPTTAKTPAMGFTRTYEYQTADEVAVEFSHQDPDPDYNSPVTHIEIERWQWEALGEPSKIRVTVEVA